MKALLFGLAAGLCLTLGARAPANAQNPSPVRTTVEGRTVVVVPPQGMCSVDIDAMLRRPEHSLMRPGIENMRRKSRILGLFYACDFAKSLFDSQNQLRKPKEWLFVIAPVSEAGRHFFVSGSFSLSDALNQLTKAVPNIESNNDAAKRLSNETVTIRAGSGPVLLARDDVAAYVISSARLARRDSGEEASIVMLSAATELAGLMVKMNFYFQQDSGQPVEKLLERARATVASSREANR